MKKVDFKALTKPKRTGGNIYFSKVVLALMLVSVMVLGSVNSVIATGNVKTITIRIAEGGIDQSDLYKTVNIPNFKSGTVKSVNNGGTATISISGDNVTVNAKGGTPSRTANNPTKYNKVVTGFKTSSTNNFATILSYNQEGYITNMAKDGVSRVTSGVYTPAESKEVTNQVSANYDVSGFQGRLSIYLYSGGLVPEDSKHVSDIWGKEDYYEDSEVPYFYDYYKDGYSGRITRDRTIGDSSKGYYGVYSGTVTKPGIDTRIYRYKGTVTKPASDTRVWRQDYKGTAYKAGNDNYYSYDVVLEYIDNSDPNLALSSPGENSYFGKESSISLQGIVKDTDLGDILNIKYTISGISAHTNKILSPTVTSNGNNQNFTRGISIDSSILQGDYILKVWVEDNKGGKSSEVSRTINIDKTKPTKPTFSAAPTKSTNGDVTVTVVAGTDAGGSGVDKTEYRIGTEIWTTYSAPFKVSSNSTIEARTIDKAGNISDIGSLVISNINRILPIITIEPYNTNWTNKDITVTAKTDKGSLNKTSYTFTGNGSFKFTATDEYGNIAEEIVTITNIDKIKPKIKITVGN